MYDSKGDRMKAFMIILLLALIGGGAYYYMEQQKEPTLGESIDNATDSMADGMEDLGDKMNEVTSE